MGAAVSCLVALRGAANLPAMALLWALYHSIVNVGQTWYAFGERKSRREDRGFYVYCFLVDGGGGCARMRMTFTCIRVLCGFGPDSGLI